QISTYDQKKNVYGRIKRCIYMPRTNTPCYLSFSDATMSNSSNASQSFGSS
ncbi:unnamed protein product, partial [Musa acuminata subsp. burmannicoides]